MRTLTHEDGEAITELLMGRRAEQVALPTHWKLDNGLYLKFQGSRGPFIKPWGTYSLDSPGNLAWPTPLFGPITAIKMTNDPAGDRHPDGKGIYEILVYGEFKGALQERCLIRFTGTDGDGNYGTGYKIFIGHSAFLGGVGAG